MWNYEKRLEYPINIKRTDAAMAKAIISQFGGPDGETGAAMRYLSMDLSLEFSDRIIGLTDGSVAFDGTPDQLDEAMIRLIYEKEGANP